MKGKRVFYALCFLLMSYVGSAQTLIDETFDSYPPTGWTEFSGLFSSTDTLTASGTESDWGDDEFANTGTNQCAKLNVYGDATNEWCVSPSIDLGSTGDYVLEFDMALTHWNNTSADVLGADDTVAVVVSLDDGATWTKTNVLAVWTADSTISNTGQHVVLSLAAYTGNVKIGFYAESTVNGNGDNDLFIDNVVVRVPPSNPVFTINPDTKDYGTIEINGNSSQIFIMSNTGANTITIAADSDIALTGANADMFNLIKPSNYPIVLDGTVKDTVIVEYKPTAMGAHTATLQITDDITDAVNTVTLSGVCVDPTWIVPKMENFDLVTTPNLPLGWKKVVVSTSSYADVKTLSSSANSDPNHLYIYNSYSGAEELLAITPKIDGFEGNRLKFYAKGGAADQQLFIGTISDLSVDTVFNAIDTIDLSTSYEEYNVDFVSYSGTDDRIAFRHGMSADARKIYVDDISWEEIPTNPVFAITPDSIDFGQIQINYATASQDFVISNDGQDTIRIASADDIVLSGPDAAAFTLTKPDTYPVKLYGSEEATITVEYAPTAENQDTAYIEITDDITDEVHTIKLTGEGVDFTITPEYTQDFEGEFPPAGWLNNLWTKGTEAHNGSTGCARVSYSHSGEAILQTPPVAIASGQVAKFWWKDDDISTSDSYKQIKGQKVTGVDVAGQDTTFFEVRTVAQTEWTTLTMLSASSAMDDYAQATVDLSAYAGETVYFRWRDVTNATSSAYGTGVDDFSIENLPANDVSTISIDMIAGYRAGTIAPMATVANYGTATQTFDVVVTVNDGSSDVFTNTKSVADLAYNEQSQVTFDNWTATAGEYTVTIATALSGDEDTSNDTLTFEILVADNLLWGNNIDYTASTSGIISTDYHGITPNGLVETADDFIVPAGEIWKVDSIVTNGFTNSPTPAAEGYGVKVYEDNSGVPGNLVFEEIVTSPVNGLDDQHQQLAFDENLVLGEGTYWITVYGYYSTASALAEGRWNWRTWGKQTSNETMLRDNPNLFNGGTDWGTLASLIGPGAESTDFAIWGVQANDDATLSDLTVEGTTVTGFSASTYSYDVELPYGTTTAPTVSATTTDANAEFEVNDAASIPGTTEVVVTAEDGVTELTYEINFTLGAANTDATLSDLTIDGTTVTGFDPATQAYTVLVPAGTTTVPTVDATTTDDNASYVVNAATTIPGTTEVVVTAEDGTTELTYSVTFNPDGISELSAQDIKLYPNPSNGIFFIELEEKAEIAIMDINGKVVYEASVTNNKAKVDISNNPAGSYIIMITNGQAVQTMNIQLNK